MELEGAIGSYVQIEEKKKTLRKELSALTKGQKIFKKQLETHMIEENISELDCGSGWKIERVAVAKKPTVEDFQSIMTESQLQTIGALEREVKQKFSTKKRRKVSQAQQ